MKKSTLSKIALTGLVGIMATGCTTTSTTQTTVIKEDTVDKTLIEPKHELNRIAVEIRDELRKLAKIRNAKMAAEMTPEQQRAATYQSSQIPAGFEQLVSIGPITDDLYNIMQLVELQSGYTVKFVKPELRHDYPITLEMTEQPLFDALMEIGAQTDDHVAINVYPSADPAKRLIVVEYKDRI